MLADLFTSTLAGIAAHPVLSVFVTLMVLVIITVNVKAHLDTRWFDRALRDN
jgi:hypothetical protein